MELAFGKASPTSQDEVKKAGDQEENDNKKCEQIRENVQKNLVLKEIELDPMSERKIENLYFRNAEQAERKSNLRFFIKIDFFFVVKLMTQIKVKLSAPRKTGDEIKSKIFLKPIIHENPWKTGITTEKKENTEKSKKLKANCAIS